MLLMAAEIGASGVGELYSSKGFAIGSKGATSAGCETCGLAAKRGMICHIDGRQGEFESHFVGTFQARRERVAIKRDHVMRCCMLERMDDFEDARTRGGVPCAKDVCHGSLERHGASVM